MNFSGISFGDTANGPGLRISLFVSGCTHHCPGCFNPDTWDFNNGEKFDESQIEEILFAAKSMSGYLKGFSLLGGEPFDQSVDGLEILTRLLAELKTVSDDFDFWCWSGYTFEELSKQNTPREKARFALLSKLDVLVDGRFVENKKDLTLNWRGSSNQRVIDVQKSIENGSVVYFSGK